MSPFVIHADQVFEEIVLFAARMRRQGFNEISFKATKEGSRIEKSGIDLNLPDDMHLNWKKEKPVLERDSLDSITKTIAILAEMHSPRGERDLDVKLHASGAVCIIDHRIGHHITTDMSMIRSRGFQNQSSKSAIFEFVATEIPEVLTRKGLLHQDVYLSCAKEIKSPHEVNGSELTRAVMKFQSMVGISDGACVTLRDALKEAFYPDMSKINPYKESALVRNPFLESDRKEELEASPSL